MPIIKIVLKSVLFLGLVSPLPTKPPLPPRPPLVQGFNPFHPLLYRQYVHRTPFTIPGINFKLSLSINFCRLFKTDSTIDKLHGGRLNLDWIVKIT